MPDASVALLHFGFGKPRETLTIEQDAAVVDGYPTLDASHDAVIAEGIPLDRLEEPKLVVIPQPE